MNASATERNRVRVLPPQNFDGDVDEMRATTSLGATEARRLVNHLIERDVIMAVPGTAAVRFALSDRVVNTWAALVTRSAP